MIYTGREKTGTAGPKYTAIPILQTSDMNSFANNAVHQRQNRNSCRYALLKLPSDPSNDAASGLRDLPVEEALWRFRRRRSMPSQTITPRAHTKSTNPTPRIHAPLSILPKDTIRAASNECHDDAPR